MNAVMRDKLNAINRKFYVEVGDAFDKSRQAAWPGWLELLKRLGSRAPLSVLDVGCGNGRFGLFLAERLGGQIDYLGVDADRSLLEKAESRLRGKLDFELAEADLSADDAVSRLSGRRFDLVVLFGLLHHIAGRGRRLRLVSALSGRVVPTGHLVATLWQFARLPWLKRKIVSWSDYARLTGSDIDERELEPNDFILGWGGRPVAHRYCHHVDDAEADALVEASGLAPAESFRADGRNGDTNLYIVLQGCAP